MKETLHFEITIKAPVEKVWEMMLGPETYKLWTVVFDPTSYYEGSWEEGSSIKFLGASGDGMFSEIAKNDPQKFLSIRHLGIVKNGKEDKESEESKKWGDAYENYTFIDKGGETDLKIDLEMESSPESREMAAMFTEMWPNALSKLKELCEK